MTSAPAAATFRKHRGQAPPDYYAIEAAGLAWLTVPGGPPVPRVHTVAADHLVLARLPAGHPDAAASTDFGRRLARLHTTGAASYGAPPAGVTADCGYIADLPLPYGRWDHFGTFYAAARVEPYLRLLRDRAGLPTAAARTFDALLAALTDPAGGICGPAEPASRVHGDLWSGNVMWSPGTDGTITGWLIDPAAHGGHRETDLAMLALFGLTGLPRVLAAYHEVAPLADGWRDRVPLHQVHPLLVHAALFGGGYLGQAHAATAAALRSG